MRPLLLPLLAVLCWAVTAYAQDSSTVSPSDVEEVPRMAYPSGGSEEVPESKALKDLASENDLSIGLFILSLIHI